MVYVFLAEGFEEIEALSIVDVLRRAQAEVETVSIAGKTVRGAHGIEVVADRVFGDIRPAQAQMLVLPGGQPGTKNLEAFSPLLELLTSHHAAGRYLAAICAAPSILGGLGILKGKKATCYPGMEDRLEGRLKTTERVVKDGNVITADGPGSALLFSLKLAEVLKGFDMAKKLFESMGCVDA